MKSNCSRQGIMETSYTVLGTGYVGNSKAHINTTTTAPHDKTYPFPRSDRPLPRDVHIASLCQHGMNAKDPLDMTRQIVRCCEDIMDSRPDVICLPEVFPVHSVSKKPATRDIAEEPLGEISGQFAELARKHHCNIICPINTRYGDSLYNSALFIDRKGQLVGTYHKLFPTVEELNNGVSPGPKEQPVVQMDFGTVGAQICFDIQWDDGWKMLQDKGAEIVFWPSAFSGGSLVNMHAWHHRYCIVSSTWNYTTKICDVSGITLGQTSLADRRWAFATVNLERAVLHTWPYQRRFQDVRNRYGHKIKITVFHEENRSIFESLSPELKVADVLKEFDMLTHDQHMRKAELRQQEIRRLKG